MKHMRNYALVVIVIGFFLFFSILSCKKKESQKAAPGVSTSSEILKSLGDDYWNHMLEENLYLRIKKGLKIEKLLDA